MRQIKLRQFLVGAFAALLVLCLTTGLASSTSASATPSTATPTTVSGTITTDTHWTTAGSPYEISGQVLVAYGATLTIDPGVEVNDGTLSVWGALHAAGSDTDRVQFTNVNIVPGASKPATPSDPGEPYDIDLSYCRFNCATTVSPHAPGGGYGTFSMRDSIVVAAATIALSYPAGDCFIERNVFRGCAQITVCTAGSATVYIRNNMFYRSMAIRNDGSYDSSKTVVEYNTFMKPGAGANLLIALELGTGSPYAAMDARNNYWDTEGMSDADAAAYIASRVYDKSDDASCADFIPVTPILTAPDPSTPILDIKPPTISFTGLVDEDWYNLATLPPASVSDEGGLLSTEYSLDGSPWIQGTPMTEGDYNLTVTAWDMALNKAEKSITVGIDRTAPVSTIKTPHTAPGTAFLDATDNANGSGVATTRFKLDNAAAVTGYMVNIKTAGAHTIEYWSTDAAGNQELPHKVVTFNLKLAKVYPVVSNPIAPAKMSRLRSYKVYGFLSPRHTAGTRPVLIYKYRKVKGAWKSRGRISATVSDYSNKSKYSAMIRLPQAGTWRLRAFHPAHTNEVATWSAGYDVVTVK